MTAYRPHRLAISHLTRAKITAEDKAEESKIKLEQALIRYRHTLQRGTAWTIFPPEDQKARNR